MTDLRRTSRPAIPIPSRKLNGASFGLAIAGIAIAFRLWVSRDIGGDQAIFSYPAIVLATLWFGIWGGSVAGIVCFLALWYYVIPESHSFRIETAAGAITLVLFAFVGVVLVWSIASMRTSVRRYRELNRYLEQQVEERTSERNRLWVRCPDLIAIIKHDCSVHAINPALSRLLDRSSDDVEGCDFVDLLEDGDHAGFHAALHSTRGHEGSVAFDARLHTHRGVASISWNAVDDGEFHYLMGREIKPRAGADQADSTSAP